MEKEDDTIIIQINEDNSLVGTAEVKPDKFTIDFYVDDSQYSLSIPNYELSKLANLLYKVLLNEGFTVKLDKVK